MIQAWYYDESTSTDGRDPHQYTPNRPVSHDQLIKLGVLQWHIPVDEATKLHLVEVDRICTERDYKNRDEITISETTLPNYHEKLAIFFTEHIHEDEEIRYILGGSGYFDIRSPHNDWIRIACSSGDMIILPAGLFHRFTLDSTNYLKAMRLFKEDPKWTPLNRGQEADGNAWREWYVEEFAKRAEPFFPPATIVAS
ncbi:1,2-dihydroxy-3-keto-5-methylthiopentene dioxygenase 3 [Phlyctochytrium arcticum]|nr:1,2-dihydroxy-3-keto-5-methylthiopentene dioxygenase 3 [Phlyctochytrium arcticum]